MVSRPLIGIVDDEESVRVALRRLCGAYGLKTAAFSSLHELSEAPELLQLDCLLLDVHMPGVGRAGASAWLRDRKISVPVIMMTGRDDDELRDAPLPAGVTDMLFKPVDAEVLLGAIRSVLGSARLGDAELP